MDRIGVRELRQHASRYLARVASGESIEVTDRGRPVALIVPLPQGGSLARLLAEGRARSATGSLVDLPSPRRPAPGRPLPSEVLAAMRAEER